MIDASTFASHYNSFWTSCAPTLEHFVRRLNLDGVERFCVPISEKKGSTRRALVAETAFRLLAARFNLARPSGYHKPIIDEILLAKAVAEKILRNFDTEDGKPDAAFGQIEISELIETERNLFSFLLSRADAPLFCPKFRGCGFVDSSEGDIRLGSTLFEVKTVDRPYRGADVRQLLTYCALASVNRSDLIERVGCINPRRGLFFEIDTETVCFEVSGRQAGELFSVILDAISSGDISR
jgi:hypothetical protein